MDIVARRQMIQQEETKPQAAVTESVMSRVGAGINFINTRHIYQHDWHLNQQYNIVPTPNNFLDGVISYPFPFEILFVQMIAGADVGTGGITELDVKWKPEIGGTFQSIFSTTPKFNNTVTPGDSIRNGQSATGWTAPVLDKTIFAAWDVLRLDLLQAVTGQPNSVFLKLWIRPINPP